MRDLITGTFGSDGRQWVANLQLCQALQMVYDTMVYFTAWKTIILASGRIFINILCAIANRAKPAFCAEVTLFCVACVDALHIPFFNPSYITDKSKCALYM